MSIAFVCTKHCKSLKVSEDGVDRDGLISGLYEEVEVEPLLVGGNPISEWGISTDYFYCPDNRIDEVVEQPAGNIAEYEKAVEEADCAEWYACVNLDTGDPIDESFERNIHRNWFVAWEFRGV